MSVSAARRPRLSLRALEDRCLMAGLTAILNPATQVLTVVGTAAAESIDVIQEAGTIRVPGASIQVVNGGTVASVARSAVGRVDVVALGGNDTIAFTHNDGANPAPETALYGGAGNDTILGGPARDVVSGGESPGAASAASLDQYHGLYPAGGESFNWGGWNEKWLLGNNGWYFVTPVGHVYQWFGGGAISNSMWVGQVDPSYYADLSRLTEASTAPLAYQLDQSLGFTATGNEYLNWGGKNEKWFMGNTGWYFILPNGNVHRWDGAANSATGPNVGKLDPAYYVDLNRVVNAVNPVSAESDNDRLEGRGGNDTLYGEAGNDTAIGGDGSDILYGNAGHDVLKGAFEFDASEANGNDWLNGGPGNDQVWGGVGNDTVIGGDNKDTLYGEAGADTLWGGQENDPNEGGIAWYAPSTWPDDTLDGGPDGDVIHGGIGNDTLLGRDGGDTLYGEAGNDTLHGAEPGTYGYADGVNSLFGQENDDDLYGGNSTDYLYGGEGKDGLFGGAGANVLLGHGGADRFLTWSPSDQIWDQQPEDARVRFQGSTGNFDYDGVTYTAKDWAAGEIQRVDRALIALHRGAAGAKLVKTSSNTDLIFNRYGGGGRGFNNGQITLTDAQVGGSDNWLTGYTLHETGHFWNGPQLGGNRWNDFLAQSGWTQTAPMNFSYTATGGWWYLTNSAFASDYAKGSPNEDFSESFAAYFQSRIGDAFYNGAGAAAIPGKINVIAGWVASL